MTLTRRHFLTIAGATGASAALGQSPLKGLTTGTPEDFDFLFFTDTHIQPELNATQGCDMAFKHMRGLKAEFAIQGGDHIFDGLGVPKERSLALFDLYDKTQQDVGMKVYHTIGNHDVLGIYPESGMAPTDPLYGKKYWEDHMGKTYYSFDRKGVHFVVLDSIGVTEDRAYEGRIDAVQLKWLAGDLKAQAAGAPIVVISHIPVVSAFASYVPVPATEPKHHGNTVANSDEVIALLEGHKVLAVLQGHTHINERVDWHGVPYITSGAVSGNWWKGTHMGAAEGFTVVSLRGGKLTTRYETYGFHSVEPENS
jgi:Icc protein